MTDRYIVGTPQEIEAVKLAADKALGLRDTDGKATPRRARIFRGGVDVTGTAHDPATRGVFAGTTRAFGDAVPGTSTHALLIPETPEVEAMLGKELPAARDLVTEDKLPAAVKGELARRRDQAKPADVEAPPTKLR